NPTADWSGSSDITVTVTDPGSLSNTDTFTLTVNPVNDAPVIVGVPDQSLDENTSLDNAIDLWVYASDPETSDDGLTYSITGNTKPDCGVSVDTNRYIDINPTADWNGSSDVTVTVTDPGSLSNTDTFSVTVNSMNNRPVANDDSAVTQEDTPITIAVLVNDTDVDGNALTVDSVTQGSNGIVSNNGSDVTYKPDLGFIGMDTFSYTADDGKGGTDIATVTVEVQWFAINNGDAYTDSRTVNLNNTANGNPTHYMASEKSSFKGAKWQTYSIAPSFTLSRKDGKKTVWLKVKYDDGESVPVSDDIEYVQSIPGEPALSNFAINNGDDHTTSQVVILDHEATNNPTHYIASEDQNFSSEDPTTTGWQPYSYPDAPTFTLSDGYGIKTVYLKVKNDAGESTAGSDDIQYTDSVPELPALTYFEISNGDAYTDSRTVNLNNTASGNPTHYMASEKSSFKGAKWQTYSIAPSFTLSRKDGKKTVWLKVKSATGESAPVSDDIEYAAPLAAPTLAIEKNKTGLGSSYPNPCNPETWIPFTLSKPSHVVIKIYDVSGQLVRTLDLGERASGAHMSKSKAAHWDGRNKAGERVSSGIYFYLMEAGSFRAMRKLVVAM
ncbi:tandem-95 repeat protein, partial [Candidatus Poribacteria bacterium]